MKLCPKAQKIQEEHRTDEQTFRGRADRNPDNVGIVQAMNARIYGSKRTMATRLSRHLDRCKLCDPR